MSGESAPHHQGERQGNVNVRFGSLAVIKANTSLMSALERIADILEQVFL